MKKILFCLLMFVVLSVWHIFADDTKTNDWGVATNGVQMSISLKNGDSEIKTNQFVTLLVRFRNLSTNAIYLYRFNFDDTELAGGVSCRVISPSGKDILPNRDNALAQGSGANFPVPPHQIYEFEFSLGNFCDFSEVGTYKITAKKTLMIGQRKEFLVVSNPLYVSVVAKK
jgi:hypothetical protein